MESQLRRLSHDTSWQCINTVRIDGDVGHPQGLTRRDDGWLVTTVRPDRRTGDVMAITADGSVSDVRDVTDGERFHPGGFHADDEGCWVAVAEYRPRSSTMVCRLDRGLGLIGSFPFDDHLGAICPLGDGTLFAVSWGSRWWYRLDHNGRVLDERRNPSRFVDIQDLQHLAGNTVIATGVGHVPTPAGSAQLGGVAVIDVDALTFASESPVSAWMTSGRVATYNAAHIDIDDARLTLHCVVDDAVADIASWSPIEVL